MAASGDNPMKDSLSMQVLWPGSESTLKTKYDLVLVHGLAGGSISTWKHPVNGRLWPMDLFPVEFQDVRVMSFGYRVESATMRYAGDTGRSTNRTLTFGAELLESLIDKRSEESRPLTFIAHGVGGIVVKAALTLSKVKTTVYGSILRDTRHVMFFDVPHHGMSIKAWRLICGDDGSEHGIQQFGLWSQELGDLANYFSELTPGFNVTSTAAHLLIGDNSPNDQVAPGQSHRINCINERTLHLNNVTHITMCQFETQLDNNYRKLVERIQKGWVVQKIERDKVEDLRPKQIDELRSWIVGNNEDNQKLLTGLLSKKHPDTCKWLFSNPVFQRWTTEHSTTDALSDRMLWFTAPSGCGKTMLCAAAIDHLRKLPTKPAVVYIFFDSDHASRLATLRMISSQLLDSVIEQDAFDESILKHIQRQKHETMSLQTLIEGLMKLLGLVFFVLDGLNEIGDTMKQTQKHADSEVEDIRRLVEFLTTLAASSPTVRLWCCSQHDERIAPWFVPLKELHADREEIMKDIQVYLDSEVEEKIINTHHSARAKLRAALHLYSDTSHSFRWAEMMIGSLKHFDTDDMMIDHFRRSFPKKLSDMYEDSLERLRAKDMEDAQYGNTGSLSMAILSIVTFSKRPLSPKALREALAIRLLPDESSNLSSNPGFALGRLRYRCQPLVEYYPAKDPEDGQFRLSHHSVRKFLYDHWRTHQSVTEGQARSNMCMIDDKLFADVCLRYLYQERYSQLLIKKSPDEFVTSDRSDINQHHLLQYAAKYWYRHLETIQPTASMKDLTKRFVESPQFLTSLQVQSLFVVGHFIQNLDYNDRRGRNLKKNLPDWFREEVGSTISSDYYQFLAEWGSFLQQGITASLNGEIDRCFWQALGPKNYFSRWAHLQRHVTHLLDISDKNETEKSACYHDSLDAEKRSLMIWKVADAKELPSDTLLLRGQIWDLSTDKPTARDDTSLTFSRTATNWDLYNPCRESTFLLRPEKDTAARPPPLQKVMNSRYMRVGASFFVYEKGGWVQEKDKTSVSAQRTAYWEQISFRHPYRLRSRTKDLSLKSRPLFTWYQRGYPIPDTDDSTSQQSSDDGSDSDFDDSPFEQFSDEESESDPDERPTSELLDEDYSSPDSLASYSDDTISEPGYSEQSSDPGVISEQDGQSSSESVSSNRLSPLDTPDGHESIGTSNDELSGDEVNGLHVQYRRVLRRRANVSCDTCGATSLDLFYRCSKCPLLPECGSFDICRPCFKKGRWCLVRDHSLVKTTVDSKGRLRKQGSVSLVRCKRELLVHVEKLDDANDTFTPIFRYLSRTKKPNLFDSPAVFHHTRAWMAMPVGHDRILLADLEHNACSSWTHVPRWLSWIAREICVKVHFSTCGNYVFVASVYAVSKTKQEGSTLKLFLHVSAALLSPTSTPTKRPRRVASKVLILCSKRAPLVRKLPFTFTWTEEALYVSMSGERLQVLRVMLPRGAEKQFSEPTMPENEIVLPRSAKGSTVHFLPGQSPGTMSIVIIGSRDGKASRCPIAVYLKPSDLGQWIAAPQDGLEEATKSDGACRSSAQYEEFDSDEDCDTIPYDPGFHIC